MFGLMRKSNHDRMVMALTKEINRMTAMKEALERELDMNRKFNSNLEVDLHPVLLERGRRVFGNLKQMKPKATFIPDEYDHLVPSSAVIIDPVPGGMMANAFILDSRLDARCLQMALGFSKDNKDKAYLSTYSGKGIVYKGCPVVCSEDLEVNKPSGAD